MRGVLKVLVVAVVLVTGAAPALAAPPSRTADVLAVVTLPRQDSLDGLVAYADRVQPGAGTMIARAVPEGLPPMAGADALPGLDPARPVRVIVLDPPGGSSATAVLVPVRDGKALARGVGPRATVKQAGGWALIAPAAATVKQLAPWALGPLAREPAPALPTATVFPKALFAAHRTQIEAMLAQITGQLAATPGMDADIAASVRAGLLAATYGLADSARIDLALDARADLAALDLAITPGAGTALASFVAAQRPTGFPLLARLPVERPQMLMAGHVVGGPYREPLVKAMLPLLARTLGRTVAPDEQALFVSMLDAFEGEFALTSTPGAPATMAALYQVSDPSALAPMLDRLYAMFGVALTTEIGGLGMRMQMVTDRTPIDGVRFRRQTVTYDYRKLPRAEADRQRALLGDRQETRAAAWDDVMGMVTGRDTLAPARQLVALSRGKAKAPSLPPAMSQLVDDARAHRDSLLMIMDLAAVMAQQQGKPAPAAPGVLGFLTGFADGRAHLRVVVPAATIQALRP